MGRSRLVLILALLAGCSVTSTTSGTTIPPIHGPVGTTTTTTTTSIVTTQLSGFVSKVYDGQTFDLQVNSQDRRYALEHIKVPDGATCEGADARSLLASLIAGKRVSIDSDGIVWLGDIDVAKAMVQYGRAKASDAAYLTEDDTSPDVVCGETTTTTILVIAVPLPTKAPKPKAKPTTTPPQETIPAHDAAPDTPAPAEPAPVTEPQPEAPPVARPTTPERPAPVTDPQPAAQPAVPLAPEPDRTPKTPATPRLPDVPPASG